MLRLDFVTLFPEMVEGALDHSILKRGRESGRLFFRTSNPRDFTSDNHRTVDDRPFGGGAGMLLKAEPVAAAIDSLGLVEGAAVVMPDPTGRLFRQSDAQTLAERPQVVFVCGHYEGIDDRVRQTYATHVFSLGDFVLTNGELPALVMADAIARLVPGVLGSAESLEQDSFGDGLLSAPQFTQPRNWRGLDVPEVLLSGDHARIAAWRRARALRTTRKSRPDLFARAPLTAKDLALLEERGESEA